MGWLYRLHSEVSEGLQISDKREKEATQVLLDYNWVWDYLLHGRGHLPPTNSK